MAVAHRSRSQQRIRQLPPNQTSNPFQTLACTMTYCFRGVSRRILTHTRSRSAGSPPDGDESKVGSGAPRRPVMTHHVCVSAFSLRRSAPRRAAPGDGDDGKPRSPSATRSLTKGACYYRAHNYRQPLNLPRGQPDWRAGSLCRWRTFLTQGVPAAPPAARMQLQQLQQPSD